MTRTVTYGAAAFDAALNIHKDRYEVAEKVRQAAEAVLRALEDQREVMRMAMQLTTNFRAIMGINLAIRQMEEEKMLYARTGLSAAQEKAAYLKRTYVRFTDVPHLVRGYLNQYGAYLCKAAQNMHTKPNRYGVVFIPLVEMRTRLGWPSPTHGDDAPVINAFCGLVADALGLPVCLVQLSYVYTNQLNYPVVETVPFLMVKLRPSAELPTLMEALQVADGVPRLFAGTLAVETEYLPATPLEPVTS